MAESGDGKTLSKGLAGYNAKVKAGKVTPHSGGGKKKSSGYKPDPNYVSPF